MDKRYTYCISVFFCGHIRSGDGLATAQTIPLLKSK